jgi:hypothetical protein
MTLKGFVLLHMGAGKFSLSPCAKPRGSSLAFVSLDCPRYFAVSTDHSYRFSTEHRIYLLLDTGKKGIHDKLKDNPVFRGIISFEG